MKMPRILRRTVRVWRRKTTTNYHSLCCGMKKKTCIFDLVLLQKGKERETSTSGKKSEGREESE